MRHKVWIVCEAFVLTGEEYWRWETRASLTPWAMACSDRKEAMRELRKAVRNRVMDNWAGCDDADNIRSDIKEVMSSRRRLGTHIYEYRYSASDREVVWRMYPFYVGIDKGGE